MKNIYKILFGLVILSSSLIINSCDPFGDFYVTLVMDTELNAAGIGPNINISSDFCLTDFSDYNDNSDKLEEIRYISAAYFTTAATNGLRGENLRLRLYEGDGTTLLFEFNVPNFVADNYIDKPPLKIDLTTEQINNINQYLANFRTNNCFKAELTVSNVQYSETPSYYLNAKMEFLTELKVKP